MGDVIDLGDLSGITRSDAVQSVYTFLQANMPAGADGTPWQPAVGALDDLLINGFGQQVDELTTLLSTASTAAFRYLGLKVHKIAPLEPQRATVTTQWRNDTGTVKTVDAGVTLDIEGVSFEVVTATAVPVSVAGTTYPITVVARDPGADGNGLSGAVTVTDNLNWSPPAIVTLAAGDHTDGGSDGEDDDAYLARLVDELQLLSRAAITVDDFARIAQQVAGVHRVLVKPLYDPAAPGVRSPGHVTLFVQGDDGQPVTSEIKQRVFDLFDLTGRAIVPIQVHVADPTSFDVSVTVRVSVWPGFVGDTVVAQVTEQVRSFLDPATWGSPTAGDGGTAWIDDSQISALALAGAIERASSVRRVTSIRINGADERADVPLPAGVAILPRSTIVGVGLEAS